MVDSSQLQSQLADKFEVDANTLAQEIKFAADSKDA